MKIATWNVNGIRARAAQLCDWLARDKPDVVCLQELPVWAVSRLEGWSGMTAVSAVARRPRLGSAELARLNTQLNQAFFRSAFTGQANAILLQPELRPLDTASIVLNPRSFRRRVGRELGLPPVVRRRWARERRVCHAVRTEGLTVANLHGSAAHDWRVADAELMRAAVFADSIAGPDDVLVLAGDFNVIREHSKTLEDLSGAEWGFTKPIAWLDQILVRGAPSGPAQRWPEERRRLHGKLLSDHAPVEVRIG